VEVRKWELGRMWLHIGLGFFCIVDVSDGARKHLSYKRSAVGFWRTVEARPAGTVGV
jgi:hypothetical protein